MLVSTLTSIACLHTALVTPVRPNLISPSDPLRPPQPHQRRHHRHHPRQDPHLRHPRRHPASRLRVARLPDRRAALQPGVLLGPAARYGRLDGDATGPRRLRCRALRRSRHRRVHSRRPRVRGRGGRLLTPGSLPACPFLPQLPPSPLLFPTCLQPSLFSASESSKVAMEPERWP